MLTNSEVFCVFASTEEAIDMNKFDIHHTTYMAQIKTIFWRNKNTQEGESLAKVFSG